MKLNLTLKTLTIDIILALELAVHQNGMKHLSFEFLSTILTSILTLRQRKT